MKMDRDDIMFDGTDITREQLEIIFGQRQPSEEDLAALSPEQREQHAAFAMMLRDLRYPKMKNGGVIDVSHTAATIAYHLVRCGWRPQPPLRVIKDRKAIGPGIPDGAIEWVGMDEPDDPLADIDNMTIRQISELTPIQRAEALRRLDPTRKSDLPAAPTGWELQPRVRIIDQDPAPFTR